MDFFDTKKINQAQQEWLKKIAAKNEEIPQSYLFTGPEETGKFWLAVNFFGFLNNLSKEELTSVARGEHPDWISLVPEASKTASKSLEKISVEKARVSLERLKYTPYQSNWQMLVVSQAQRLTTEASNSLLKFIEEPPPQTGIILLTNQEQQLLPTLRSRVHTVRTALVGDQQIGDFLEDLFASGQISVDKDNSNWKDCLRLAEGRPLRAARFLLDPKILEESKVIVENFRSALRGGILEGLALAEKFSKQEKESILRDLAAWINYLRRFLLEQIEKDASRQVIIRVETLLEELLKITTRIESSNVNTRLELENFFVQAQG
jgi:DNA polymerase III gamma/tau subunit